MATVDVFALVLLLLPLALTPTPALSRLLCVVMLAALALLLGP